MVDEVTLPGFLSTLPANQKQRLLAFIAISISLAICLVCLPFAQIQLPAIWAFIPIYESALLINDLITASLLFVQFSLLRSRALLALACAYLFAAIMVVPHALTFPGLFSATGLLGAGPQSTAWIYMFWHAGFPILTILYAIGDSGRISPRSVSIAIFGGVLVVLAAAIAFTLLATAGQSLLPQIMAGNNYTTAMGVIVLCVAALILLALGSLLRRRPYTVLDLWLMVAMCAWICDVALSAVFNAGRFDLGFYAGRIYGLTTSTFVLLVLLFETEKLYAQLIRLFQAEQLDHKRETRESRRIFETSLDLILVTDSHGTFLRVSPSAERILGYRPEEMTGHNGSEFIFPEDLDPTRDEMRLARRGHQTRNFETRYLHKDGHVVSLAWTGVWSESDKRHFFIGRDMSEARRAEKALRQEMEDRKHVAEVLNNTITSMVDPVLVADEKGKILVANSPAQKIFGKLLSVDSDKYQREYERYYPDGVTPFPFEKTALFRAVHGEAVDDLEFVIHHKGAAMETYLIANGRPIRNEQGALQGAVAIYRDITEKKKSEQAIRDSEQMARGIIDTALDAFLQLDENEIICGWSPQAEAVFGWSREEAIGQGLREIMVPAGSLEAHAERMTQFLEESKKGTPGMRFEMPGACPPRAFIPCRQLIEPAMKETNLQRLQICS